MDDLIPTNAVAISETHGPKGWLAGRYDGEGFISSQRWFPTREAAEAYAKTLTAN